MSQRGEVLRHRREGVIGEIELFELVEILEGS
jgi:hypothetical protein